MKPSVDQILTSYYNNHLSLEDAVGSVCSTLGIFVSEKAKEDIADLLCRYKWNKAHKEDVIKNLRSLTFSTGSYLTVHTAVEDQLLRWLDQVHTRLRTLMVFYPTTHARLQVKNDGYEITCSESGVLTKDHGVLAVPVPSAALTTVTALTVHLETYITDVILDQVINTAPRKYPGVRIKYHSLGSNKFSVIEVLKG